VTPKFHRTASGPSALAVLAALAGSLFASVSQGKPAPHPRVWKDHAPAVFAQFSFADFDGDHRPDFVVVQDGQSDSQRTQYWIAFHLSGGLRRSLDVLAPWGGLQISSLDINNDGFLDVVVRTQWTNQPVAVLLNDGSGNFRVFNPSAFHNPVAPPKESWASFPTGMRDASAMLPSICRTPASLRSTEFRASVNALQPPRLGKNGKRPLFLLAALSGRAPPPHNPFRVNPI